MEVAAFILNIDPDTLEEGVIDKDEYISVLDSFFVKDGKHAILIHYQPMEPPPFGIINYSLVTYTSLNFERIINVVDILNV